MNQTNILVVASSVAALLTLGVVTFSQWVAPWVPLAVGAGWAVLWAVAWVTLKNVGDVDVPDTPADAMPALVSVVALPLVGVLWMAPPVRAAVAPIALDNSPDAVDSIIKDSSAGVRLAACASAKDVDPAQWSAIADAIADRPDLAVQCTQSLTPELVDAVADRWATALKRPNLTEATACMLTEKLVQLREGRPQVLTRDLMQCADQSQSEAARACCEQTFDASVDPASLLAAGQPTPSVLASFIRVQFQPGKSLDEQLAGKLLDATCNAPDQTEVTAAYLPYVREECAAGAETGWIEAYGTDLWTEACAEELPYFRDVQKRSLDEAVCRGMETAAVAMAVEEAMVGVGHGRSNGRSADGVSPGVLADVERTARARGGGTSGAGVDQEKAGRQLPPEFMWSRRKDLIVRGDPQKAMRDCKQKLEDTSDTTIRGLSRVRPGAESTEDLIGFDPCTADEETISEFGKIVDEDYDPDAKGEDGELKEEDINAEALMKISPNSSAAQKLMQEMSNASKDR
jgi:hypothetical protein